MKAATRIIVGIFFGVLILYTLQNRAWRRRAYPELSNHPPGCIVNERHPIDSLISTASRQHEAILSRKVSHDLHDGSARYRERRGRHPPPGFDAWYRFAQQHNSVVVEDFFDQIYHDIEPFWGLKAADTRSLVAGWSMTVKVRNGKVVEVPNKLLRTSVWVQMITQVVHMLPDMDIPINHLDEARVIASRSVVDEAINHASKQRERMMAQAASSFSDDFTSMAIRVETSDATTTGRWSSDLAELHKALRDSCPVTSTLALLNPPWTPNADALGGPDDEPRYVDNMTFAKSICDDPRMTVQHGALVEPATVDFTTTLMPLFTGSKLPLYNDIVIPEPSYYSDKPEFTGKDIWGDWSTYYAWGSKQHSLIWRGSATGGGIHNDNWSFFHRHRLISHLNSSELAKRLADQSDIEPNLESWLASSVDAGFTKLYCDDAHDAKLCPDLGSHFGLVKPIKMGSQYKHKYLPDVDGNSVSERFRAFLLSNSAPLKATIFDDWHDHRLLAWQHFIPMHISYRDLYDIMAYFLGCDETCSHDQQGQTIAENGRDWARQVLRREDMIIYVHRVLLEYARVVHEDRDHLGYVSDLLS